MPMPQPNSASGDQKLNDTSHSSRAATNAAVQEHTFTMGDITALNVHQSDLDTLQGQLTDNGYRIHRTPHFMIGNRAPDPADAQQTLLVHWFDPAALDSNLGYYMKEELKPLGLVSNPAQYADVFGAIVNSASPDDLWRVWHLFATNTLQRMDELMGTEQHTPIYPIERFAALYTRVQNLCVGTSLLDAGCSQGFLSLMMAERLPRLTNITGVDIQETPFALARAVAQERRLTQVNCVQADLLSDELAASHRFDTVTLLHVLEHVSEPEIFAVLANLLKLTEHRLIIAVPYDQGEPEQV